MWVLWVSYPCECPSKEVRVFRKKEVWVITYPDHERTFDVNLAIRHHVCAGGLLRLYTGDDGGRREQHEQERRLHNAEGQTGLAK